MRLIIIGGGQMGQSFINGLQHRKTEIKSIFIVDPFIAEENFSAPVRLYRDVKALLAVIGESSDFTDDILLLAVKPQDMITVLASLPAILKSALIITLAAGIALQTITDNWPGAHPSNLRLIRCMPNTPAAVGAAMTVFYANDACRRDDIKRAEQLFTAIGEVHEINDEDKLHAVTAISGSGPAYIFAFLEAFIGAAENLGLPTELARKAVLQTATGSLKLLQNKPEAAARLAHLRRQVTSTGGTTEAAMQILNRQNGLAELLGDATEAAQKRSRILANSQSQKKR